MARLADALPRPLYEDVLQGLWVPVVGSGMSRNARVPDGDPPPDWNGLASVLKRDLADPDDTFDAVDVISAYAQEHGRPALVERVSRAIRIADAQPGEVHLSLCRLPVDVLVTTNFDQLLEQAFREVRKPCHPVLDELQLAISNPYPGPALLKLHGDVSRPERMVLTEEDFDRFLIRNPLFSTVVASHFAQRSIVLIGYSLSDPDLRQIVSLVRERLGEGARAIYALEVDAPPAKVARFARRHVRVVSLPGDRRDPGATLRLLFDDLFAAVGSEAPSTLEARTHEGGLALRSAKQQPTGCFLSTAANTQADYIEWLGPVAARVGVPLISPYDFISAGDNLSSTLDAMVASASCAIVEAGPTWSNWEIGAALNRLPQERVLLVTPPHGRVSANLAGLLRRPRPQSDNEWSEFADFVEHWLASFVQASPPPDATLDALVLGEVMHLSIELEHVLGDRLGLPEQQRSLSRTLKAAVDADLIDRDAARSLLEFVDLRNRMAHGRPVHITAGAREDLMARVREVLMGLGHIE